MRSKAGRRIGDDGRARRASDSFAEAAGACRDLAQLGALLGDAALELGFDHFALLDHASLTVGGPHFVRIDNYPRSWVLELLSGGHAAHDPVHLASRRTDLGFAWSELGRIVTLQRHHKAILERGRRHGLGTGFTVPSNVSGEPSASCSFAVRVGRDLPAGRLDEVELVGAEALRAARRLAVIPARSPPRLSRREVDCLRFLAMGKSDWEIARILGLSIHTARQYVRRARAAYDVVSRTQLVLNGLRDAWITFEDAIPPNE